MGVFVVAFSIPADSSHTHTHFVRAGFAIYGLYIFVVLLVLCLKRRQYSTFITRGSVQAKAVIVCLGGMTSLWYMHLLRTGNKWGRQAAGCEWLAIILAAAYNYTFG